jgi:protoheme IX farnesyltransferase
VGAAIRRYYALAKPGIVYGNDLSVMAGALLASVHLHVFHPLAVAMALVGLSLVMASGCVYNNVLDRNMDAKMARTRKRALVSGDISVRNALVYATVLGVLGLGLLALYCNWLSALLGFAGMVFYVLVYGWFKRRSVYGTEAGSISGAIPPLAGYVAVSNHIDIGAFILFLLLVLWQMPHFFAIAMYRVKDYKEAGVPVLPARLGMKRAKNETLVYIGMFVVATSLLTIYGYTGYIFLAVMLLVGLYWFVTGLRIYKKLDDETWGKKMFFTSLWILLVLSAMIPLGAALP